MVKIGVWIIIVIQSRVIMVCRGHIAALNGDGKRVLQDGVKVCGLWQWIDQVCCVDTCHLFPRPPRAVNLCVCVWLSVCLSVWSGLCILRSYRYLHLRAILSSHASHTPVTITCPNHHRPGLNRWTATRVRRRTRTRGIRKQPLRLRKTYCHNWV